MIRYYTQHNILNDKTSVRFALTNDTSYLALTGELWGVIRGLYKLNDSDISRAHCISTTCTPIGIIYKFNAGAETPTFERHYTRVTGQELLHRINTVPVWSIWSSNLYFYGGGYLLASISVCVVGRVRDTMDIFSECDVPLMVSWLVHFNLPWSNYDTEVFLKSYILYW